MSPKNKGTFGRAKPNVEETDEFVSGVSRIADRLRPYALRIVVFLGVIVLGLLAYTVYGWWGDKKAKEGTELYVQATDVMRRQVIPEDQKPEPDPNEPPVPDELKPVTYETLQAQAQAQLDAISKLSSENGSTAAAENAALLEARSLLDLGKHDEALKQYRSFAKDAPTALLAALAREGVGYALEAKAMAATDASAREAGLREALEAFRKVQTDKEGPRWLFGRYHEARILATLGNRDEAVAIYKEILAAEPPPGLEDATNARLAMLDTRPAAGGAPDDDDADQPSDSPEDGPADDTGAESDEQPEGEPQAP